MLEAGTGSLHGQCAESIGKLGGELQAEDSAERNAQQRRALQTVPVEEFCQIRDEIFQSKAPPQRKAIVFATEMISDYTKMIS
jgi:hypothetical protein